MQIPVEIIFDDGVRMRVLTRDVSASGIFIFIDRELGLEDTLRFLITFPEEITTSCRLFALCDGAIVRKEPVEESVGGSLIGVAVKIQRYQFLSSVS
jgi:hypothetical protein